MSDTLTPPAQVAGETPPQDGGAAPNLDPGASGAQVAPTPPVEPDAHDPEKAARLIANLREDKRKAQEKADLQAAELAKIERAKLTESEAQAADLKEQRERADRLEGELKQLKLEGAFKDAAVEAGIRPKAVKLALAAANIEIGEDGQPANLPAAIEALRADHDYLFGGNDGGQGDGAGGQPPAPGQQVREPNLNPGAGQQPATGAEAQLTADELAIARRAGIDPAKYLANRNAQRT